MSDYTVKWDIDAEGNAAWTLEYDGEQIASGGGTLTEDEIKATARVQAEAHSAELNPLEPTSGEETFTL